MGGADQLQQLQYHIQLLIYTLKDLDENNKEKREVIAVLTAVGCLILGERVNLLKYLTRVH